MEFCDIWGRQRCPELHHYSIGTVPFDFCKCHCFTFTNSVLMDGIVKLCMHTVVSIYLMLVHPETEC